MSNVQAIGITDQQQVCDCCGKINLNQTVVLRDEYGVTCFFGTVCAARALGFKVKNILDAKKQIRDAIVADRRAEREKNLDELIEYSDRFAHLLGWKYKPSDQWNVFSNNWLKHNGPQFLERAAEYPAKYPAEAVVLIAKMIALRIITDV